MNETSPETTSKQATALGMASLTLIAIWQAARIEGESQAPAVLQEIEQRIEAGTATLAINIQRVGGMLHLTAAVLDVQGFQAAFEHPILNLTGPLIISREQLAHMTTVTARDLN